MTTILENLSSKDSVVTLLNQKETTADMKVTLSNLKKISENMESVANDLKTLMNNVVGPSPTPAGSNDGKN